jgi:hypothetical protein
MRKPSATLLLVTLMAAGLSAWQQQPPTVAASAVKPFVGQYIVVEDVVAQISREPQAGFMFLNFGAEFPNQVFRAIIPLAVERYITGPALPGTRVRLRGAAQIGPTGVPEIVCSDPSQLTWLVSPTVPGSPANSALSAVSGAPAPQATPKPASSGCCRVCSAGKACGDGCIAKTATCRQPPGCACGG